MTRYLLLIIVLAAIIFGWKWLTTKQGNVSSSIPPAESARSEYSAITFTVEENNSTSFGGFQDKLALQNANTDNETSTPALPHSRGGRNAESEATQKNQVLEHLRQTEKKTQYQQLLADTHSLEGNDKLIQLQEIWKMAPEVGIDDELLTLLQLSTYDADARIEQLARKMLDDLNRFKEGKTSSEVTLVNHVNEMNNATQDLTGHIGTPLSTTDEQSIDQNAIEQPETTTKTDINEQRTEKIAALKTIALETDNPDTRNYALNNLMGFDQAAALEVIQYQLQNSINSEERIRSIEHLRSAIGDYDNDQIRQLLETASYDDDVNVADNANATLEILDNYMQAQDVESIAVSAKNIPSYIETPPDGRLP